VRLSTRFGIGAAVAVLPLIGVIGIGVGRMQALASSNQRLTERTVIGLHIGVGILARLDRLDEYLRKHMISKDAGYARLLRETMAAIGQELERLRTATLSPAELAALRKLDDAFAAFSARTSEVLAGTADTAPAAEHEALVALASSLQHEMRRAAEQEARNASELRERAWQTAVGVAAIAVLVSTLALLLTVRALRTRLDQFIRGTEAVSAGTFSYQLDSERDDELDRAAAAFNQMVDALDELERMKADFLSSVSHELRTPLVAMQETTNLLLDEVVGPLSPRQRKMLELNTEAGRRLSRMITELLELHRLKAGIQISDTEHDLVALTRTAVSQLEGLAHDREIVLGTELRDAELPARCDPDRYVQVVQNLVENALKYTPRGGVVEVRVEPRPASELPPAARVGDRPRRWALLRVEDSGPGIPVADRQRVFEKFFRRDGLSSDGGAGLGLAICREIVEAHGGSVWIEEARALGGAALNVALPLAEGSVS